MLSILLKIFQDEGYFRYGRAPSPQAFTGEAAKFNMAFERSGV
jgi:hypothetical protein